MFSLMQRSTVSKYAESNKASTPSQKSTILMNEAFIAELWEMFSEHKTSVRLNLLDWGNKKK